MYQFEPARNLKYVHLDPEFIHKGKKRGTFSVSSWSPENAAYDIFHLSDKICNLFDIDLTRISPVFFTLNPVK